MRFQESLDCVAAFSSEGSFERLRKHLPLEWIEAALKATGTATIRRRRLPAEQVIWLVLGMALFRKFSIVYVVSQLQIALPSVRGAVAASSIPDARARLGYEPLEYLFSRTAEEWAHASADRDRWRGLALYGVDGTTIRVPDSPENRSTFGNTKTGRGNGESGYPMVRMVALMALRSHLLADARFDGCAVASEIALAKSVWEHLPNQALAIIDRGFFSADIFSGITEAGRQRHWLTRVKKSTVWTEIEKCGPSDALVELNVSGEARRKNPNLPKTFRARAIAYQRPGFPPSTLLTSLLDAKRYPARELIALYHERWELELGYDEIKTHLLDREEAIRSKSPDGIRQEIWGILLTYNLVRLEMERVADAAKVSPLRISFINAMRSIQCAWIVASSLDAPGRTGERLKHLRDDLKQMILPARRPERQFPRAVKIKMSNYPRKRPPTPAKQKPGGTR